MTQDTRTTPKVEALALDAALPSPPLVWWYAIRPRTLTMAVVPVVVGAVLAWHETHTFALLAFLAALISALAIQIGTNLLNDAADGESGADRPDRLGPPRVTAQGWASARSVRRAAAFAFAIAAVAGVYCIIVGGLPIVAIGMASLICGWGYSRGPLPIAGSAAGEMFVLIFFGIAAVMGTAWLMNLTPSLAALPAGILVGLPAAAVLLVNNHRDRVADFRAGRRTLAILLGPSTTARLYAGMLVVAALFGLIVAATLDSIGPLATLAALPLALRLGHAIRRLPIGRPLNGLLGQTARYQVIVAVLLCAGLLVGQ